mmetsp:Transcript_9127/g.28868  ORF Transcript_9127/g.28868 Transcript_9127/m.28868 type:complete len:202 (-) Transcript_9127:2-607(-)
MDGPRARTSEPRVGPGRARPAPGRPGRLVRSLAANAPHLLLLLPEALGTARVRGARRLQLLVHVERKGSDTRHEEDDEDEHQHARRGVEGHIFSRGRSARRRAFARGRTAHRRLANHCLNLHLALVRQLRLLRHGALHLVPATGAHGAEDLLRHLQVALGGAALRIALCCSDIIQIVASRGCERQRGHQRGQEERDKLHTK